VVLYLSELEGNISARERKDALSLSSSDKQILNLSWMGTSDAQRRLEVKRNLSFHIKSLHQPQISWGQMAETKMTVLGSIWKFLL
jgi:hypothetical protein